MLKSEYNSQILSSRIFGDLEGKVGMVGDGANDLMAIKEADIGIAINNTDAMHSADFTVEDLSKIKVIIIEGRCTEKNLVELVIYCSLYYLLYNVYGVICMADMATYPSMATLVRNLTCFYPLSLFMAFFVSSGDLVKHRPTLNMLGI
jgi:magnesium-transporting ATPase (P-type)